MNRKHLLAFMAVLFVVLTACSGTMDGVVRKDAKRVKFEYSGARIGTADVQVTMPQGERFEGRTHRGREATAPNAGVSASSDRFETLEGFYGNADAVLFGDRGNIMKCRFHLTDVLIGFPSGGFGLCQLADGRVIDIFF
ncbi:MAG: hypothetical protein QNL14_01355 [Deltaproteobacteria bacterium]|nr:hypothetical protein [Deltaproteobacteria bacterium]